MDNKPKSRFPSSIVVLVVIAALFGFGTGFIIISSQPSGNNPIIVVPTSSLQQVSINAPAPDFTLNTLAGKPVALKDFHGKRLLINFWASWCPPCLQETPDLAAAYKALSVGDDSIAFVGIGTQDDTAKLKKFADDNQVPYTILADPQGKISDAYGVIGLPTTVLVDGNGIVRKIFTGPVTKDQVMGEIKNLTN